MWDDGNEMTYLNWPALSTDSSPAVNIRSDMSRVIYGNAEQYSNPRELQTVILVAWASTSQDKLIGYASGMQVVCLN